MPNYSILYLTPIDPFSSLCVLVSLFTLDSKKLGDMIHVCSQHIADIHKCAVLLHRHMSTKSIAATSRYSSSN